MSNLNQTEYYQRNGEKIFNSIKNPNHRVWKVVDADGTVKQNKLIISSPSKLINFILSCSNPVAVYVSASTYLSPHKFKGFLFKQRRQLGAKYYYPHGGYIYADNILIDSYFFIDLDSEIDLRIAQEDARKILNHLTLKLHSIQFSGKKGIHLIFEHDKITEPDPIKRIQLYKAAKKQLADELIKLNLKCFDEHHYKIMQDCTRVYAAPYTLKTNGRVVTPLDYNQFMNEDIYSILNPASEQKCDDLKAAYNGMSPSPVSVEERAGLSSPIYFRFIDNMVRGLANNYITVIRINKKFYTEQYKRLLKKAQRVHKLSDFYVEEIGEFVFVYNTKLVQFDKLIKIMRMCKSENLGYFFPRKHYPMHVSDEFSDGVLTAQKHKLDLIKSEFGLNDMHSLPHSLMLGLQYNNMTGELNTPGTMMVD